LTTPDSRGLTINLSIASAIRCFTGGDNFLNSLAAEDLETVCKKKIKKVVDEED
jgi:GTP cyclohydrolase III